MALTAAEQQATIALADGIAAGDRQALAAVFAGRDIAVPTVAWSPTADALAARQLVFLLDYWNGLRGAAAMAPCKAIEPVAMRPALGYVCLLDVLDDGLDFHYRVYGSDIAHCVGADLTRTKLSDYTRARWMLVYHAAAYRAVVKRGDPLFTSHAPTTDIATARWDRLILPLSDDNGAVGRLLVGKVPNGRRPPRAEPPPR